MQDELEMTFAAFSPDGIFLATAQTDDVVQLYDTRFLTEPVLTYRHEQRRHNDGQGDNYGITGLKWVNGWKRGALGLVTAGSDGCVRLWDVGIASDPSLDNVIARVDHAVACISVGTTGREHRLVVADCGGGITIFD